MKGIKTSSIQEESMLSGVVRYLRYVNYFFGHKHLY
jgi:hypothetical protein